MDQAIGSQLRQKRLERHLSLEQVAQATHIRLHYLQALEAGDFAAIPSEVQAHGFLRAYASFLGLDGDALLANARVDGQNPAQPDAFEFRPPAANASASSSPPDSTQADQAFVEVGRELKRRRELLGISLEDVEKHTHLRLHYLESLEAGRLEGLPSPMQGRGMLSNYASFLGMDPEPLLLRYAEGLQRRLAERQAARPSARSKPRRTPAAAALRLRRIFSGELLVGIALVAFVAVAFIWAAIRIFALRNDQSVLPTAPSIAEVLLATAVASPTHTPLPPTPTAPVLAPLPGVQLTGSPTPPGVVQGASGGVQVYVTARHRAWMRVLADEKVKFEGRVLPGSAYAFSGEGRIELLTGDGDALQVFFNQQDLGPIGLPAQVVHLIFTIDGLQTPTPTVTLTPTPTPRTSPTPTATGVP